MRTRAGTWAASEAEARFIERAADADEQWEALLRERQEWVNRPVQPPGLGRSGILELAASTVELRRRKQKVRAGKGRPGVGWGTREVAAAREGVCA